MSVIEQVDDKAKDFNSIRFKAMDMLSRREHSSIELQRKLIEKFPENTVLVDKVIEGLQQENLQSDERFTEAFVSARAKKGQGPRRIRMELQQRGITESIINKIFSETEIDWFQLAVDVLLKKYKDRFCSDYKERSKRSGFLHYRGFTSEQIAYCFNEDF